MATLPRTARIRNPALFICDIQEKFRTKIYEFPKLVSTTSKLVRAANTLNFPIYISTQSRAKLGETVSELSAHLQGPNIKADVDKTLFSMITPELSAKLPSDPAAMDAVILGIETHICVTQTTLELLGRGYRVYVVVDGVSSVNPGERKIALERLRDAGAIVTSSESLLFEILVDAKNDAFRAISGLVKETSEETKGALEVFAKI
ncbi:Isochorismatase-like protein [Penicillium sp. IBT 16267x]|nr:Isochorismatase-like protein [Penicillium sp. IBT 16267x]